MDLNYKEALKKPWVKYTLMGVAVIGVVVIVKNRMGGSANTQSGTGVDSATIQAEAQLQSQQNALAAQNNQQAAAISASAAASTLAANTSTAQQVNQINGTLSLASLQQAGQIALATLSTNEQTALANISLQGLQSQLTANTSQQQNNLNATVALSNINAGVQIHSIDAVTGLQTTISNNQTAVANKQTDASVAISNNNSSGCFITTAICDNAGLPDDCYQLVTLRKFRDEFMMCDNTRARLIAEYYRIAPSIVARLNRKTNAKSIYSTLKDEFIDPAIENIENGDNDTAMTVYINMVNYVRAM